MRGTKGLFVAAACLALALTTQRAAADEACKALEGFELDGGKIDAVVEMAPPDTLDLGISVLPPLPVRSGFCRVQATLKPVPASAIRVEVWLPPKDRWNGRLLGAGNAGYAGTFTVPYLFMDGAVARGYAAAGTDTGHDDGGVRVENDAIGANWAHGQPEKIKDYGYRANQLTAAAAKSLVKAYYGEPQKRAYFQGCSNGGREALMLAQRAPELYDGIIAGAPANDWSNLMIGFAWSARVRESLPEGMLPVGKLAALQGAALKMCDALDGVEDGMVGDPPRCRFDPEVLRCKGEDGDECLSAVELEAVRKLYQGPRDARGKPLFPGFPAGHEAMEWNQWLTGPTAESTMFVREYFRHMVFEDPEWELAQLDFDKDFALAHQKVGHLLTANDPDLRPFARRGGKLILYHGWGDAAIPPQSTIDYYERVRTKLGAGAMDAFARLYMIPGMGHCMGGPGPSDFDALSALEHWVEEGKAPQSLVASKYANPFARLLGIPVGEPVMTRPLCPYPQLALWRGEGSTDEAANFSCAAR